MIQLRTGKLSHLLLAENVQPKLVATAREIWGMDRRSLALLRIGLASILIVDLLDRASALRAHYTDFGVMPRSILRDGLLHPWSFSIHLLSGGLLFNAVLFALALAMALLLLVGYHTHIAAFASWVLLVSLQNRNPLVLHSGDVLLRLVLFWSLFLPLGDRFSLGSPCAPEKTKPLVLSMGTIGLWVQFLSVFVFLVDQKLIGTDWTDGTALYYSLSMELYGRPAGLYLTRFPYLLRWLDWAVLSSQILVPLLLCSPLFTGHSRFLAVVIVVATQIGFGVCMTLGIFPLVTSVAALVFLPAWFWEKIEPKLKRLPNFRWQIRPVAIPSVGPLARRWAGVAATVFGAFCLLTITLSNVGGMGAMITLGDIPLDGRHFESFSRLLRLDQRWAMFAPNAPRKDGWYVTEAKLRDGSVVNVFPQIMDGVVDVSATPPISWQKPSQISSLFPHNRWAFYMMELPSDHADARLRAFGEYVCRFWNSSSAPNKAMVGLTVHFFSYDHLPNREISPVERVDLWNQDCSRVSSG